MTHCSCLHPLCTAEHRHDCLNACMFFAEFFNNTVRGNGGNGLRVYPMWMPFSDPCAYIYWLFFWLSISVCTQIIHAHTHTFNARTHAHASAVTIVSLCTAALATTVLWTWETMLFYREWQRHAFPHKKSVAFHSMNLQNAVTLHDGIASVAEIFFCVCEVPFRIVIYFPSLHSPSH